MSGSTKRAKLLRINSLPWAGSVIGVSLPSVYKLIREKKLRAFKFGRATRTTIEFVQECIVRLELESREELQERKPKGSRVKQPAEAAGDAPQ
jgi:excisionase family DNA binding protein